MQNLQLKKSVACCFELLDLPYRLEHKFPHFLRLSKSSRFLPCILQFPLQLLFHCPYVPKSKGSKFCRELTEKVRNKIKSNNIIGFNHLISFAVNYDKALCAYIQKSQIKFELLDDEKIFVPIEFGDEKIAATGETTLKISRNVSVYNSPLEGPFCKDLGRTLKKIEGSAVVSENQFDRLVSLVESGKIRTITMGNQKFNAILKSLGGRPNGKVKFVFLEVRL